MAIAAFLRREFRIEKHPFPAMNLWKAGKLSGLGDVTGNLLKEASSLIWAAPLFPLHLKNRNLKSNMKAKYVFWFRLALLVLLGTAASAPSIVQISMEADLLLTGEAFRARADIDRHFGMDSPFQAETGFYAHAVGLGTITLVPGWEERLVPFGRDEGLVNIWALEIHDLAASKLMAGREKDFEFLRELLERGLCEFSILLARFELLREGVYANAVPDRLAKLAGCLRAWGRDDLAKLLPQR